MYQPLTRYGSVLVGVLIVGMLVVLGFRPQPLDPAPRPLNIYPDARADVWAGVVIVKFKERVLAEGFAKNGQFGLAGLDELAQRFGVEDAKYRFPIAKDFASKKPNTLGQIITYYYTANVNPYDVAAAYAASPHVAYAEPDFVMYTDDSPDDPQFSAQAQFNQVAAATAWDQIKGEDGEVIIAVVDDGADWQHPDLVANVWTNPNEIAGNGVDDDGNGFRDDINGWNFVNQNGDPTPFDNTYNHGTHVSGIAAARTNNTEGIASLSWNVRFMGINAADPQNNRAIRFGYDGIEYAMKAGAHIVNCSWGGSGSGSQANQELIDLAYEMGVIIVASSGNGDDNGQAVLNDTLGHYPSNYNHVVSVGSTQPNNDNKAGSSNFGVTVDVFAPGVSILSTITEGNYASFSGTSMASPMVAALAALLKTKFPGWSVDQIIQRMRVTADPIDGSHGPEFAGLLGRGRINAARALDDTFESPAIRLHDITLTDPNDGIVDPGDRVFVTAQFTNYLDFTQDVDITLSIGDANATVVTATDQIGVHATDFTETVTFEFDLDANVPEGQVLYLYFDIDDGTYQDRDLFAYTVRRAAMGEHRNDHLQTSVTRSGRIGNEGGQGAGFVVDDRQWLDWGALLIGTSENTISDAAPEGTDLIFQTDWVATTGLRLDKPGALANEQTSITLDDSNSANPLGLSVLKESYLYYAEGFEDFMIYQFTVTNTTANTLNDLYIGLMMDWNLSSIPTSFNWGIFDATKFDAANDFGYVADKTVNPKRLAAIKVLSGGSANFSAMDTDAAYADGLTPAEKWAYLTGNIGVQELSLVDAAGVTSSGPHTLGGGASVTVAFALVAGRSLAELQQNVAAAAQIWADPTVPIEPAPEQPQRVVLHQNYPNPFNPTTTIAYALPQTATVNLQIYNVMGQVVRTLVTARKPAGLHQVQWDGRDGTGGVVASGTYWYRLSIDGKDIQTKSLVFMK